MFCHSCMHLANGRNMLIKLSSWGAAKAAGVYQLQGLHWHGYHILGCPPSVDHDAFLHVAKYLRDHGIHRQTREGGKDRRPIREVNLHTLSILPLCICICVTNCVLAGWHGSLDSQWDRSLAMNAHGSLSTPSLGRHLSYQWTMAYDSLQSRSAAAVHNTNIPHDHSNLQQLHPPLRCCASHAECYFTVMTSPKHNLTISMTSKHVSKRRVQVSHHPPVGAAHAENKDWEYDMVSAPTTKFLGNSIDIYPIGWPFGYEPCTTFASCRQALLCNECSHCMRFVIHLILLASLQLCHLLQ